MNQLEPNLPDDSHAPDRPDRWDEAIVAGYLYDLLRGEA
jgi:hypothetical protein